MAEMVKSLRSMERPVCACGNSTKWRMLMEAAEARQLLVWPLGRVVSADVQCDVCGKTAGMLCEVALVPARTDTAWFHDLCFGMEIRFIRGRLSFDDNPKMRATFPSMLVIFRPEARNDRTEVL